MEEKRKWIEGYEGLYWITNFGRVISAERYDRYNRKLGGVLKLNKAGGNYLFVNLYKNGVHKQMKIHRLVAKAFIPNPENKREVDHIDNDKSNNMVTNLRWVTHKENQNNEITRANMLKDTSKFVSQAGADNPFSRKVKMYSLDGKYIRTFETLNEAGRYVGVSSQLIGKVCKGKRISAGGYCWSYEGKAKMKIKPSIQHIPTNKRAVLQFTNDDKFVAEYPSVADAANALGIYSANIIHCAKGESITYKGYKWRYK